MNSDFADTYFKDNLFLADHTLINNLTELGFSDEFIRQNFDKFSKENMFRSSLRLLFNEKIELEEYIKLIKSSNLFEGYDDVLLKQAIKASSVDVSVPISLNDLHKLHGYITNENLNNVLIWDYQDDNTYLLENIEENNVKEPKVNHYKHFIAAGLACLISRTITAPLERLKILYQVNYAGNGLKPPNIIEGLKQVYNNDGLKGLFRGNSMSLLKSTPDSALKFYFFEKTKYYLRRHSDEELAQSKLFIAGAVGGVIANICVFPLDVIKTRMSAAPKGTYNGIKDTALKLYKEAGFRGFYKGIQASICCTIPNAGLNLSFYELLKRIFSGSGANDNANSLSTPTIMFIGGLSAMISSTTLYPLQTIQSRLIMQGLENKFVTNTGITLQTKKTTMYQLIQHIQKTEGIKGLFKGYCPGITKVVLGNALGFSLYENIKRLI
jgi:solute carrier family 25 phosphate transporter 23/24/25/41